MQAVAAPPPFLSFPAKIDLFIAMSVSRHSVPRVLVVMTRTVTATQVMATVGAGIAAIMAETVKTIGKIVSLPSLL